MRLSRGILIAPLVAAALPSAAAAVAVILPYDMLPDSPQDYPDKSRNITAINLTQDRPYTKVKFSIFLNAYPARRSILPSIELDRNGDRKTDRMVGSPAGRVPGVYDVRGSKLTKVGSAKAQTRLNTVTWSVATSLVLRRAPAGQVCWRAVTYTKAGKRADLAPDKRFVLTGDQRVKIC